MDTASFLLITPDKLYNTEKPYAMVVPAGSDIPKEAQSTLKYTRYNNIMLTDARGLPENDFSHEKQGFKFKCHPVFSLDQFIANTQSVELYCQRIMQLVTHEFHADKTFCYDLRDVAQRIRRLLSENEKLRARNITAENRVEGQEQFITFLLRRNSESPSDGHLPDVDHTIPEYGSQCVQQ
ncbi:hypothetical protein SLS58_007123, partial [Diplodia intermedia]